MMNISESLFESEYICLAPIDYEKDPEVESRWTHNAAYLRMLSPDPARPMAPAQIKKKYEAIEKQMDENKNLFYFTIRMRDDDRLIGFARLHWIEWSNGTGMIQLGIGDSEDRGKDHGNEALRMLLRYAFAELNLYRLTAFVPEYNQIAQNLLAKAGFVEEVRRRQALNRDGRRWDMLHMGLLRREWQTRMDGGV
ncbi:GNAT family N-acetyltransferase [Chloroflexota bacterium]